MQRGLFISFEGNDGCGKTTQIKMLEEYLKTRDISVILTREPGGTIISEKIRDILLDKSHKEMDAITEMLLYTSSRAQHVAELIKPSINKGITVICDRFIDSSLVYQGIARNIGIEKVWKINEIAIQGFLPDLTFLLDMNPEAALTRRKKASESDRLESENMEFHNMVYEGYKNLKNMFPNRIVTINAKESIEGVHAQITEAMEKYIRNRGDIDGNENRKLRESS